VGVADPDLDLIGEAGPFDVVAGDSGVMLIYLQGDQCSVVGKGTGTDAYEPLRTTLSRTRVNKRLGPGFSNVLPIEIMAPPSTAGTPPLFSYI
jgi:hypothetical protein